MSKRYSTIAIAALLLLQPALKGFAQVSLAALNIPNSQDFNTLALAGIGSLTPKGWVFLESGTNADTLYTAAPGTGNTGNTFSFGAVINPERAFGGVRSAAMVPLLGASFMNNTGVIITRLHITYTGEQWRLGAAGRPDKLDFQYSLDATSLNSGTWMNQDSLDFIAPRTTLPTGAVNGNDPANRVTQSLTINGLWVTPGSTFWIRWTDFDALGADDGLAIDDFFITAFADPPVIEFTAAADSVAEGDSLVVILSLSRQAIVSDTLHVAIGPAVASYGYDYTTVPGAGASIALFMAAGDTTLRFTISAIDDTIDESVEHVTFSLSPGNGFEVGAQNTFILGIVDNDRPSISFEVAADSLHEGESRLMRLVLTSPLTVDLSVKIKVSQDHGLEYGQHQDYTTSPSIKANGTLTLVIPAGATEATFEFKANLDQCEEGDEAATFTIVSQSGDVTIGSPASLIVTIQDTEPCLPIFVLHPNPTHGQVNIWTVHENRKKIIEGSLIGPNGNVIASASATVYELGDIFTEALSGKQCGFYYVRLVLCGKTVNMRLIKLQ